MFSVCTCVAPSALVNVSRPPPPRRRTQLASSRQATAVALKDLKLGVEGRAFRKWRKNAMQGVSAHYFKN